MGGSLEPQLRGRLDGLTDEKYVWSPVPEAWSGRPRGTSPAPVQVGAGDHTIDFAFRSRFPHRYESWEYAGDTATALHQLENQLEVRSAGVRGLGDHGLRVPIGAKEPFPEAPMAALVQDIHRELIHLPEVCPLRDLHLRTRTTTNGAIR